jgi:AraC-like DNA-binding protein
MFERFKDAVVSKIGVAIYVAPGGGRASHSNRPLHGFVINDETAVRDYVFADGRVMRTSENELFYLPKGSTYYVKAYSDGGCYAINFDTVNEINCEPFSVKFRNIEPILKAFKNAEREWRTQSDVMDAAAKRAVYDIIINICNEEKKSYMPDSSFSVIAPALEKITSDFTESDVTVAGLASLCGISEAYFRRLFEAKFGVSPKEYVIEKRIGYAKQLLETGEVAVSDTAFMCGYSEITHFSREFTKRVGMSPNEYKKRK